MILLLELAWMFAKLVLFSFGGGYVMIPIMLREIELKQWATAIELTDIVAIASISPGSVAINAAIGLGYRIASFPGAIAAFLGIALPNTLIILMAAIFFFKVYKHPYVKAAFYGLRPVISGIILYAAVSFALRNSLVGAGAPGIIEKGIYYSLAGFFVEIKSLLIIVVVIGLLIKTKIHPIIIIFSSGAIGWLLL